MAHPIFEDVRSRAQAAQETVLFSRTEGPSDMGEELGKIAQESVEETVSEEVFASYPHNAVLPQCLPHPGDIVEAGSLAAISLPEAVYPLADSLPPQVISTGLLSSLQLEGVLYACQRHQMILPNRTRAGFFIGDGAGVGKGRQISGILLDNFARGRCRHVWFSISTDLIVDAKRDLTDIGCHVKVIEGCQQLDKETRVLGLPADFKEGVIFSTYATLVSSVQKGGLLNNSKQSRLQQLIDWCGGAEFQGCLIFDECHKAKNFVPGKEQSSTKVALAVTSIQRLLPKARVVYCSATGVTDVKNMAFMERLGLWGDGATFRSFEQFIETVQRKGLGVAEMLAMEMKSTGMYLSRGLSFKQAQFETVEIPLTKEQVKTYNLGAHVWNEVMKALDHALARCGVTNQRVWSSFWGAHQRFFKQLCMGMKVPAIVAETKRALENGCCVVIGLQTTGEASMESELGKTSGPLKGFVSLCREMLLRFIEQNFPTVVEGKLNEIHLIILQKRGGSSTQGSVEDEWSVTAKQMLLGFAKQIELPNSPLDEIIDQLGGVASVAEMTGRKGRIMRHSPSDPPQYEVRGSEQLTGGADMDSLNVRERNLFMEGKKLVAIISDAASTGISLHADLRCDNQRRRVHLTFELPWSADKAVQQLGRSHRSNQSSGPLYKLLTTNLGGERRFAAAVARRLQSLGALTKGDRRAASGADLTEFNFDTPYGRQALKSMYSAICQKVVAPGLSASSLTKDQIDFAQFNHIMMESLTEMGLLEPGTLTSLPKVKDGVAGDVGRFLNRILGIKVEQQNLIFNYFCKCMEAQVFMAKTEGRYNEGLVDITATSVEMVGKPRQIFKNKSNHTNNPTSHLVLTVDRGMPWDKAVARLQNHPGEKNGFYISRREVRGQRLHLLATVKENSTHLFKIARPNTGLSSFDEEISDLTAKYTSISQEKAEKGWKEQYHQAESQCIHGSHCKNRPSCTTGARCYKMHLLSGGIVTLMSLLESTLAKYGPRLQLTKSEMHLRVVRLKLNSGERVVGVRFPELLIPLAERELVEQKAVELMLQKQAKMAAMGLNNNTSNPAMLSGLHSENVLGVHPQPTEETPMVAVVDDVSPVNPRLLTKATTPPITIRNFFKPVHKPEILVQINPEKGSSVVAGENNTSKITSKGKSKDGKGKGKKVKKAPDVNSTGHFLNGDFSSENESGKRSINLVPQCNSEQDCGSHEEQLSPRTKNAIALIDQRTVEYGRSVDGDQTRSSPCKITSEDTGDTSSFTDIHVSSSSSALNVCQSPKPSSTATNTLHNDTTGVNSGTASPGLFTKKRTHSVIGGSVTRGPPQKKVKQGNILQSLMKQKSKQEEIKQLNCPICGTEFPAGSSNTDVNNHIDNCLIE